MIGVHHIALWAEDLEKLRDFCTLYFGAQAGEKYTNPTKGFSSYLLHFGNSVALELMKRDDVCVRPETIGQGWCHVSFSVGSAAQVDRMTELLRRDGFRIVSEPRTTGDGFYESSIEDPEGNLIEITV